MHTHTHTHKHTHVHILLHTYTAIVIQTNIHTLITGYTDNHRKMKKAQNYESSVVKENLWPVGEMLSFKCKMVPQSSVFNS